MVFSTRNQEEKRILSEIRECLLQDPRFARLGQDSALDGRDKIVDKESYHVAAGIVPEPSIKPIERQAIALGEVIAGDNPNTAPIALAIDHNSRPPSLQSEEISSDSPSIAPDAPSMDPSPQQRNPQSEEVSRDRPSVAKRLFRIFAHGFIITVIVSTAFVWQSADSTTKDMVQGWVNSLVWSSHLLPKNVLPESDVATEAVSATSDQRSTGATVNSPTVSASQPAPTSTATESSPDLKKQLEAILIDLANVRRIVEQVAASQEQLARNIATLQADEQDVSQKISAPLSISHHLRRAAQHR